MTSFAHKDTNFEGIRQYHAKADLIAFETYSHFSDLEQSTRFMQLLKEKIK